MTTQEKLIHRKQSLLELAEYLKNVSAACRVMGVSRQYFYYIKQAYEDGGVEALREQSRLTPNLQNRTALATEAVVVELALAEPALGQVRVANELRKRGIVLSPAGVRCMWLRHGLEMFKMRLKRLEAKAAEEGWVFTEAQLVALEKAKQELEGEPEAIETHHPGYLLAQDTMYVGYLKGVGRIVSTDGARHVQQCGICEAVYDQDADHRGGYAERSSAAVLRRAGGVRAPDPHRSRYGVLWAAG